MEQEGTRSEMGKDQEPLKEIRRIIKCTVKTESIERNVEEEENMEDADREQLCKEERRLKYCVLAITLIFIGFTNTLTARESFFFLLTRCGGRSSARFEMRYSTALQYPPPSENAICTNTKYEYEKLQSFTKLD
jgi:hypothetical protein